MPRIAGAQDHAQVNDPPTPATGRQFLWFKSDGHPWTKRPNGEAYPLIGSFGQSVTYSSITDFANAPLGWCSITSPATGAPTPINGITASQWFVETISLGIGTAGYFKQFATPRVATGGQQVTYVRDAEGGVWGAWVALAPGVALGGSLTGTVSGSSSVTTLNQILRSGWYNAENLIGSPAQAAGRWWYVQVITHLGNNWSRQIAWDMTGGTDTCWTRTISGTDATVPGNWTAWIQMPTGYNYDAAGDIMFGSGDNGYQRLPIGTAGQVLASSGTAPYWTAAVVQWLSVINKPGAAVNSSWLDGGNLTAGWNSTDLNVLGNRPSGFYNAANCTNTPLDGGTDRATCYWQIMQVRHDNTGNNYGFQIAHKMTGNYPAGTCLWFRSFVGGGGTDASPGTFTPWLRLGSMTDVDEAISGQILGLRSEPNPFPQYALTQQGELAYAENVSTTTQAVAAAAVVDVTGCSIAVPASSSPVYLSASFTCIITANGTTGAAGNIPFIQITEVSNGVDTVVTEVRTTPAPGGVGQPVSLHVVPFRLAPSTARVRTFKLQAGSFANGCSYTVNNGGSSARSMIAAEAR